MTEQEIKQRKEESTARKLLAKNNAKIVAEAALQQYRDAAPDLGARSNDLQFYHDTCCGRTFAVLPPEADELRAAAAKLLGGATEVAVNVSVGVANLNKKAGDVYDRKIGRLIATSKLNGLAMRLVSATLNEGRQDFILELGDLSIGLRLEKKSCPKFLFAHD